MPVLPVLPPPVLPPSGYYTSPAPTPSPTVISPLLSLFSQHTTTLSTLIYLFNTEIELLHNSPSLLATVHTRNQLRDLLAHVTALSTKLAATDLLALALSNHVLLRFQVDLLLSDHYRPVLRDTVATIRDLERCSRLARPRRPSDNFFLLLAQETRYEVFPQVADVTALVAAKLLASTESVLEVTPSAPLGSPVVVASMAEALLVLTARLFKGVMLNLPALVEFVHKFPAVGKALVEYHGLGSELDRAGIEYYLPLMIGDGSTQNTSADADSQTSVQAASQGMRQFGAFVGERNETLGVNHRRVF